MAKSKAEKKRKKKETRHFKLRLYPVDAAWSGTFILLLQSDT